MSLTNKLQSILSTKRQIKDAINSKGGSILTSTPFSEYPNQILSLPSGGEGDNGKFKELFTKSIREITKEDLEGVTSIPEYALYKCTNLNSISIPNSVTSIGQSAFNHCDILTSVVIPDSVTSIGYYAFAYCSNLINIELPDTLAEINAYAFRNCSALTSIFIPISVNTIDASCFDGCTNLTIYCEAESKPAGWSDSWNPDNLPVVWGYSRPADITYIEGAVTYSLRSSDNSAVVLSADPTATEVIIPEFIEYNSAQYNVSTIPANLLQENTVIETLEIPFIGLNAETPRNLGYLWDSDSSNSSSVPTSLKNVSISAATIIRANAFFECSSFTSIVIPDSVTLIGDSAFYDCSNLNKVNFTGTIDQWAQIKFYNLESNPVQYAKNLYINNELVTEINLTTATKISDYAFSNCSSLTSVVIPDNVTTIGNSAFRFCDSLTSIKYRGTQEQWNAITKGENWDAATGNYTITYNYTGS